jgi:O-antigen polymerase
MKSRISIAGIILSLILFTTLFHSNAFTDPFILPKYFFLAITGSITIALFIIYFFRFKYKHTFSINSIDLVITAFVLPASISYIIKGHNPFMEVKLLSLYVLLAFYLLAKPYLQEKAKQQSSNYHLETIITIILLLGILQPLYGIAQYMGVINNQIPDFRLGGAYGNPGPYSNSLIALLPFSLTYAIFAPKGSKKHIAIISVVLMLIVLPLTHARTAWIAAVAVIGYAILHTKPIVNFWNKYFYNWIRKITLLAVLAGILLAGAFALTSIKKDSASGRKFIYKVTLDMVKEKPVFGHGYASFPAVHNNFQADYFRENPNDWENAFLADGINYAFNEYLQIASELGIFGLALFLLIPFFSFSDKKLIAEKPNLLQIAAEGSLIAILISSLFSYPLQDYGVLSVFFLSLLFISINKKQSIFRLTSNQSKRRLFGLIGIVVLFLFIHQTSNRIKAEKEWKSAFELVRKGHYEEAQQKYIDLYPVMKYNQFFVFNYGAELTVMQQFQKSINVLQDVEHRLNDSDFYIYLGSSQEGIGLLKEAFESFEQASYIMPVKFYPRYRMVLLHQKLGEMEKAKALAQQILDMPIKVDSDVVSGVRQEMKVFLNSYSE